MNAIEDPDYRDLYTVAVADPQARTAEGWLREFFETPPAPVRAGLRFGWRLITLRLQPYPIEGSVLGWKVEQEEPDAVRVAVRGSFGLRAGLEVRREAAAVTFSTHVEHPSLPARILWLVARPLHPTIVRGVLRRSGPVT